MVKQKKFWTVGRVIISILILLLVVFFLYKFGLLDGLVGQLFSTSSGPSALVSNSASGGGTL